MLIAESELSGLTRAQCNDYSDIPVMAEIRYRSHSRPSPHFLIGLGLLPSRTLTSSQIWDAAVPNGEVKPAKMCFIEIFVLIPEAGSPLDETEIKAKQW
jgi:hypothetical protein